MIDSDSNLLSDLESELKSMSSVLRSCDDKIVSKTRYLIHHNCIQTFFYRLRTVGKLALLKNLLQKIENVESLSLLLNTFYATKDKMSSYTRTTTSTNFVFDQYLNDHNRMLDDYLVEVDHGQAVKWFSNLDDGDQVLVIIGLLRISGGAILYETYGMVKHIHECLLRRINNNQSTLQAVVPPALTIESNKETDTNLLVDDVYDPDSLSNIRYKKLKKEWKSKMDKYAARIKKEESKLFKKDNPIKPKKGKKGGKSKKGSKSSSRKSSKSSKSSSKSSKGKKRKNKKSKKKKSSESDLIQELPINVVKQIFDKLDKRTLKKAKAVNQYWKWAIVDLIKDRKAKAKRDKMMAKMANGLEPIDDRKIERQPNLRTALEKRIDKLTKRGAICTKLRLKVDSQSTKYFLISDTLTNKPSLFCYFGPYDKLDIHPRLEPQNVQLYHPPELIFKDVGVICEEIYQVDKKDALTCQLSCSQLTLETDMSRGSITFY